ncbi:MAG: metal ABC transporter substrate-binding protein [Microcoleus sp. PH2017_25_DOB_D_A]|nr:metal ABC transporter substrate-binding protein [Microcoleus sp. PH2017_02_FOX_O_A]MCC3431956.1 metal ABC transporter substrate-binding protein [Microcoleus sp. PH2017_04_SCI_O_A]MCC3450571.1 metal ABC transporter substrate-binding protein [Microcoleus sp. PH2017_09_SFU_O_A]MCC3455185.1 metal ABC transporter substrate-binding protein [Microcoleus sp. PH2017_08_TRC_O_A]MCC3469524.1 metal ABC transporter substrate-binding protein [Microcoleus sp. PH2017_06_SFM_O_A]MCC3476259.1 metal ABC trans
MIGLGLLLGVCVTACNTQTTVEPQTNQNRDSSPTATDWFRKDKKVILTTFTVLADMAQNVAGDKLTVQSITKPGAEIHGYEVTPSDLKRGQGASLILDNGLNLERWATRFYNSLPKVPRITVSEGINPINIAEDSYKGKPNPHAWMSPKNALIYVRNIRRALSNADPANAATYEANSTKYSQQIEAIDEKLKQAISAIPPEKRYIVSCEGAFSYIARDYGLKEVYIWPVNAEQQSTPKQVERVINTVKANKIPAVFCESTVSNEAQLQVAKETGAKFAGVFYVDSLSPSEGPASTYLKMLEYNVNTLIKGLQGNGG